MTDVHAVLTSLTSPRQSLAESLPALPPKPGLYAIWGPAAAWSELGLEPDEVEIPLYVGKAEDSVVTRDLKTHFADGRTGSSTVRRSFAALLREQLALTGMPRNPAKPGYFSNYGLSSADDAKLTRWMRDHLELAVWLTDGTRLLVDVESDVLRAWHPPLNIAGVEHRWRARLQQARKLMADEARLWSASRGHE